MLVLLLIIQNDKWLLMNDFVSALRVEHGVKLIEVDNHSETELVDYVLKVIKESEEGIALNFYAEGNASPGQLIKIVNQLMKQKSQLKQVVFEGDNKFFPQFKAVLQP